MDGIVYLTADFTATPGTQTSATVDRGLSAAGPWSPLGPVDLLGQVGVFYDTTAPLDTLVWYRWTTDLGDVLIQGPYIELGNSAVLLKDPLRPWANLSLTFCASPQQAFDAACAPGGPDLVWVGLGDKVRRADANLFDVYGAEMPADIYGRRKRLDGELRILSRSLDAATAVETLFTAGGPLQLQLPPLYGWPDAILQPGDLTESYLSPDQRRPYRLWSAPFTLVSLPLGPKQGTTDANWCAVRDTYATFADLTATGLTWAAVASGTAVAPDDGFGLGPFGDGPFGDGG